MITLKNLNQPKAIPAVFDTEKEFIEYTIDEAIRCSLPTGEIPTMEKWTFKKVVDNDIINEYKKLEYSFHWEADYNTCLKFWNEIEDGWEVNNTDNSYFARIVFYLMPKENMELKWDKSLDKKIIKNKNNIKCIFLFTPQDPAKTVLHYGPFSDEQTAQNESELLQNDILKYCSIHKIPIKLSGKMLSAMVSEYSNCSATLTPAGIEIIKKQHPTIPYILEDHLGINIFLSKHILLPEYKFVTQNFSMSVPLNEFDLNNTKTDMSNLVKVAYLLLNNSYNITDLRIAFLYKIFSLEVLVSENKRKPETYQEIVSLTQQLLSDKEISIFDKLKQNKDFKDNIELFIKNINSMLNLSIGQKATQLIDKLEINKNYYNLSSKKFLKKIYSMRSCFVHTGNIDKDELITILPELDKFITDILENAEHKNIK